VSEYLVWTDTEVHRRHGTEHFLVVGASGSGKTTIINNLMASAMQPGVTRQALVYDPKQEIVPLLYSLNQCSAEAVASGKAPVRLLNPFDKRCCAWDMAADIDSPVAARQLATILVPDGASESGGETFFTNAVRDILAGVIMVLMECVPNPKAWTFRDVVLAMLYEPYLNFLFEFDKARSGKPFPVVQRLRGSYLNGDPRTNSNIRASINAKLAIYEPIAAVWHRVAPATNSSAKFSLADWANRDSEEVLVLGNDEAARAALDAVNQAIFKRATELVLAREEQTQSDRKVGNRQVWFFLDEVREAGRLDGLSRLLTKGRSKGACIVLGFQDIDGLRDVYGSEVANEICAQCNNIAVLRVNSPSTADWASDLFGRRLAESRSRSIAMQSDTDNRLNMDIGRGEEERPRLYTEAFLYLDTPVQAKAVVGFVRGPDSRPEGKPDAEFLDEISFKIAKQTATPDLGDDWLSKFSSRPASDYYLEPWDEGDWKRLGFEAPFRDLLLEGTLKQEELRKSQEDDLKFREEDKAWRRQERARQSRTQPLAPVLPQESLESSSDEATEEPKPRAMGILARLRQRQQRGDS